MKILNAEQMRQVDAFTIANEPIASIDLMERAAYKCYYWIAGHFAYENQVHIFTGPGNNGGDGMAIARMLALEDYPVNVFMLSAPETFSADTLTNYKKLIDSPNVTITLLNEQDNLIEINAEDLVVDALFGSGLSRPLNGLAQKVVTHINQSHGSVVAIDMPSGLFYDGNHHANPDAIVRANHTLSFQLPKLPFFFADNEKYIGDWHILDIDLHEEGIELQNSLYHFLENKDIFPLIKERKTFSHKGTFGHGLMMAGSFGKMGAAILASRACLRTGIGLLTVHVARCGCEIIQTTVPEAIVSIDAGEKNLQSLPDLSTYNALGIGPGIGTSETTALALHQLLQSIKIPLVMDADALNILSTHPNWFNLLPENCIITPHPGEFDRLTGTSAGGYERFQKQLQFSKEHKVIVVLKGAYTSVTSPDGRGWFNSTGNPGMSTAGSGDALTGIILSLLAQWYQPLHAALIAVYLHGRAGDLACKDTGEEALIASDIINYIGQAFFSIKNDRRR
jgi:ADP-dependent NAD(P)H-hydrate dehydratase / NAD(P)H-hydrate epimerase